MTRTFVVGEAPEASSAAYHERGARALRGRWGCEPARTDATCTAVSCEPYERDGLPTQRTKAPGRRSSEGYYHALGHGVGPRGSRGADCFGRAPDQVVAGDVVTLEPGCYEPDVGGCRLEDLVLVTEDGFETLTDYPYDLEP